VAGQSNAGTSTGVLSAQVTVAAGGAVQITITRSASQLETGYVIYRSRINGTNTLADLREMIRIPVSGAATTVWVDTNRYIPGTTKAFIFNPNRSADVIAWRQLLPMIKFQLYPTNQAIVPWAQLLFGYLRIAKLRQVVVVDNIVPTGAIWQPFGSTSTTTADLPVTG
jgi:hypothetical protein